VEYIQWENVVDHFKRLVARKNKLGQYVISEIEFIIQGVSGFEKNCIEESVLNPRLIRNRILALYDCYDWKK
jgi:hypothetical protein